MFAWRRSTDLSQDEPTEEIIWDTIDEHDPHRVVDIIDRLEQHRNMLVGRDVYCNFFMRSPILLDCNLDSLDFEDPVEWVSCIKLKTPDFYPLEKRVDQISHGYCDILQPSSDNDEQKYESGLLSHRQLRYDTLEWPRDSLIGQIPSPPYGYVVWARHILSVHKTLLQKIDIYGAVYASLFDYGGIPPSWVRSVAEFWDPNYNTCWIGPEEFTISLWELQAISGLPIFGYRYEECVPPDEEIFRRQPSDDGARRGRMIMPSVYPTLLNHYRQTHRATSLSNKSRSLMPVDIWIHSFLREDALVKCTVSLSDPFDVGLQFGDCLLEETAEPLFPFGHSSPALPDIDSELLLAGFLATWLSIFVLPTKEGFVRPEILLAASRLSRGDRISLAPAVLSRIFRLFRVISKANSLDLRDITLPWQYINAWIHLHVHGAFTCLECPSYFLERDFPTVIQLSQASSTFEREWVRLFFFAPHWVINRFRLIYQPEVMSLPTDLTEVDLVDGLDERGNCTLFHDGHTFRVAEYFFSLRPGWLCYRFGDIVVLEGYQPNRAARQFGYSQATAHDGRPFIRGIANVIDLRQVPVETRFYTASMVWLHLLRLGTGSRFRIAAPHTYSGVSFTHLARAQISFGCILEEGVRKYNRQVRRLSIPRGQRPWRGVSRTSDIKVGIGGEDPSMTEHTNPHSRVHSIEPSPSHMELLSPRHRRKRRHQAEVTVNSNDQTSSPPSTPMNLSFEIETSCCMGLIAGDNLGTNCPDVPVIDDVALVADTSTVLPSPSLGSFSTFHPDDLPGVVKPTHCGVVNAPVLISDALSLVVVQGSSFGEPRAATNVSNLAPTTPIDVDYQSGIPHRYPSSVNSSNVPFLNGGMTFLREVFFRLDLGSPESWSHFVPDANAALDFLARLGLEEEELRYWEARCREVEFLVRQLLSSHTFQRRDSLSELQERIRLSREAANVAHDELERSTELLRCHRQGLTQFAVEIEGLTTQMECLWRQIGNMLSHWANLQR